LEEIYYIIEQEFFRSGAIGSEEIADLKSIKDQMRKAIHRQVLLERRKEK
jgi:hypothetical protein